MNSTATFAETLRLHGVRTVAMFGDSITVGMAASTPSQAWPALFAAATNTRVINRAISGTVLQNSPDADGTPRADNGLSRCHRDLIAEPADAICILYGYNDARYMAAPDSFNLFGFRRDYAVLVSCLLGAGFAPEAIAVGSPPFACAKGFAIGSAGFTGQTRDGFGAYVGVVGAIARQFGLAYAPVYEVMAARPDGSLASPDVTHPNDEGHRLIARAFLEAGIPR
ncbi:MAG: SGNH/GDSL hydrolase family protein [Alphaproteobacteria bacterium]|nr:SGNH/GDSL hydrolase family protein [Alphaproteobacteria bacterium]